MGTRRTPREPGPEPESEGTRVFVGADADRAMAEAHADAERRVGAREGLNQEARARALVQDQFKRVWPAWVRLGPPGPGARGGLATPPGVPLDPFGRAVYWSIYQTHYSMLDEHGLEFDKARRDGRADTQATFGLFEDHLHEAVASLIPVLPYLLAWKGELGWGHDPDLEQAWRAELSAAFRAGAHGHPLPSPPWSYAMELGALPAGIPLVPMMKEKYPFLALRQAVEAEWEGAQGPVAVYRNAIESAHKAGVRYRGRRAQRKTSKPSPASSGRGRKPSLAKITRVLMVEYLAFAAGGADEIEGEWVARLGGFDHCRSPANGPAHRRPKRRNPFTTACDAVLLGKEASARGRGIVAEGQDWRIAQVMGLLLAATPGLEAVKGVVAAAEQAARDMLRTSAQDPRGEEEAFDEAIHRIAVHVGKCRRAPDWHMMELPGFGSFKAEASQYLEHLRPLVEGANLPRWQHLKQVFPIVA